MGPSGSQRSLSPFISGLPCTWSNSSGLLAICLLHTHKKMGGRSKRPNIVTFFGQTQSLSVRFLPRMFYWCETIMTFVLHFYPGFSAVNNVTAVLLVIVLKIQPQTENSKSNHRLIHIKSNYSLIGSISLIQI